MHKDPLRRYPSMEHNAEAALQAMRRSAEVLEEAARDDPSNSRVQMNLVYTYKRMADHLTKSGSSAAAERGLLRSITLGERVVEKDPRDVTTRRILASSLSSYGSVLADSGRREEGLAYTRKAAVQAEEVVKADPSVFTNAIFGPRSMGWLGSALLAKAMSSEASAVDRLRDLREAASWLRKTVDAWKPLEKFPEFARTYRTERDRTAAELAKCQAAMNGLRD